MEETLSFIPLLLVVFLAFMVPIVLSRFKKLRLPIVVGEILAGIIIGPSIFDWVQPHVPVLDLLAEFGFVFLMFISGMEIDFSSLRVKRSPTQQKTAEKRQLSPLMIGGLSFFLTMILSAIGGLQPVHLWLCERYLDGGIDPFYHFSGHRRACAQRTGSQHRTLWTNPDGSCLDR